MADEANANSQGGLTDFVAAALAGAREIAGGRGGSRPARRPARRYGQDDASGTGGYSGPAPDEKDPQPAGALLGSLIADRGWQRPLKESRVFTDWTRIVGAEVAARCRPVSLREGVLSVAAESTAWATQLRLLAGNLLARISTELGPEVVSSLRISGPSTPSWKHGAWSVRGRGPRDTYG